MATYDPDLWYQVKVKRVVLRVRGVDWRPKHVYYVKGDVLAELEQQGDESPIASAELDQTRNPH